MCINNTPVMCRICEHKSINDVLLDAIEQIKILNAGKDNDIEWLVDKAIAKAEE